MTERETLNFFQRYYITFQIIYLISFLCLCHRPHAKYLGKTAQSVRPVRANNMMTYSHGCINLRSQSQFRRFLHAKWAILHVGKTRRRAVEKRREMTLACTYTCTSWSLLCFRQICARRELVNSNRTQCSVTIH